MPGVLKEHPCSGAEIKPTSVRVVDRVLEGTFGVLAGIKRFNGREMTPVGLLVQVLGVLLLNFSAISQHQVDEVTRCRSAVNVAVETVFDQRRQVARVVDVRVGKESGRNRAGVERQMRVVFRRLGTMSLLHPTVHKDALTGIFDQMHRAGDLPRGAVE